MDSKLTLQDFWDYIEDWREHATVGTTEYLDYAQASLSQLPQEQIVHFKDWMDAYLDHAYAPGLWEAATAMKNGCSDDSFLDFRAWLIAQGKGTYLEALRDPDSLSKLDLDYPSRYTVPSFCEFEEFLYLPSSAYEASGYSGDLYNQAQGLSQEELEELRGEIHYAPWLGQMSRTREEMEEHLPQLFSKTGFSGEPGWLYPDNAQSWGSDWQLKPNPTMDQSMQM